MANGASAGRNAGGGSGRAAKHPQALPTRQPAAPANGHGSAETYAIYRRFAKMHPLPLPEPPAPLPPQLPQEVPLPGIENRHLRRRGRLFGVQRLCGWAVGSSCVAAAGCRAKVNRRRHLRRRGPLCAIWGFGRFAGGQAPPPIADDGSYAGEDAHSVYGRFEEQPQGVRVYG